MPILFWMEAFGLTNESGVCEDPGMEAMRALGGDDAWPITLLWLSMGLALGASETALVAFVRGRPRDDDAAYPSYAYKVDARIVAVWVWSTTLALATLLSVGRRSMSIVFKFVHVAAEMAHLAQCLLLWRWYSSTLAVLCLACVSLAAALTMDCTFVTDAFAGAGGGMDLVNLGVFLLQRPARSYLGAVYALRAMLIWHATYVSSYFLMTYAVVPYTSDLHVISSLRMYGVLANGLACYMGGVAVDRVRLIDRGASTSGPCPGTSCTQRTFAAALAMECVESTTLPDAHLTRTDLLGEPVPGWAIPASGPRAAMVAACAICSTGMYRVEHSDDETTLRIGPLVFDVVARGGAVARTTVPRYVAWRVTAASLRRGRVVAWTIRIGLARALLHAGVFWPIACGLAGVLGPLVLTLGVVVGSSTFL